MNIVKYIKDEIKMIRERDPSIKSDLEVFTYASFKVMLHYKLAHFLFLNKRYFLARVVSQRGLRKTGIEIHPGATIGDNVMISAGAKG